MCQKDRVIEVTKCIYCKDTEGNSREHIIPDSLLARIPNNAWIIQKGSCVICQEIINKFETDVIRNMFKGIRPALGMKKGEIEIFKIDGNPISSPDAYLCFDLLFGLPCFITKQKAINNSIKVRGTSQQIFDPQNLIYKKSQNIIDEQIVAEISISPINFALMIAKIAYGFYIIHKNGDLNHQSIIPIDHLPKIYVKISPTLYL